MSDTATAPEWRRCFGQLAAAAEPVLAEILDGARVVTLDAAHPVFAGGSPCESYLLVLDGAVRVQLLAANGREVTLYRVASGDSCVLTTSCLLGGDDYPADAVTETPVRALALPRADFERALDASRSFRRFVFEGLGERLSALMRRMDEVAFGDIDVRLAGVLLGHAAAGSGGSPVRLSVTHQALAAELGSAREVISRHLKRFESHGWVALGRGTIEVLDREGLVRVARAGERR